MSQLFKISEVIRAADSAVNASKAAKASADAFSAASTDDPNAPQRASPLDLHLWVDPDHHDCRA